jgi:hypothetical protein
MTLGDVPVPPPRSVHRASARGAAVPERSWTPLGTVDAGDVAYVDDAGLVQLHGATWSLDWWVGAEDRWHHPSVEVAVRRAALDDSPVVETSMRVPGGDVVHRATGVVATAGDWSGPAVLVEVENRTAVPVALAFVVRPVVLDGIGRVRRAHLDAEVVHVDGRPAALLARPPARVAHGTAGEVAGALAAGVDAEPADVGRLGDDEGRLEVAVVVPLPHTATARLLLPVPPQRRREPAPAAPWDAPTTDAVAKGWAAHTVGLARVAVPEPGWDAALDWAARMLLLAGPRSIGRLLERRGLPGGPSADQRAAEVAEALARLGAADALDPVALALVDAQRLSGEVRLGDRTDGAVALLHAAGGVLAGPAGERRADVLVGPVAKAIHRFRSGRGTPTGRLARSAERAGRALVPGLLAVGQPEVAEDALAMADRVAIGALTPEDPRDGATLTTTLAARDLVLAGGAGALDALIARWNDHLEQGRSDVEDPDGRPVGHHGFDVAELATRVSALLDLLVSDGAGGPVLFPAPVTPWIGGSVEAHGVRTAWGATGVALRWHGSRPAVLWEVETARGLDPSGAGPAITAPGFDAAWSGTGWQGEGLLAEPDGVAKPAVDPTEAALDASLIAPAEADPEPEAPAATDRDPEPPASPPIGEGTSFT